MRFQFTPAAERALATAAGWSSIDTGELHLPEVLLGLLAEPECRSALLLAPFGIDVAAVRQRFTNLAPALPPDPARTNLFSADWLACLQAAEDLLFEYPRPLQLATEHLLLGIAVTENEVAQWLRASGVDAEALEAEVHRLAGHQPGPLPLESLEPTTPILSWNHADDLATGNSRPQDQLGSLRVIDAAANRASEGLRVIEDYLRFILDDAHLTRECKNIRHQLTAALSVFASADRHAARETRADVGTTISESAESIRGNTVSVLQANIKRVEQSLRSLEEFSKTISPETSTALEQLRYRIYTLEKAVETTRTSLERLANARLYVLVDGCASVDLFRALVEVLIDAKVGIIQLRDKNLADRELLARARLLAEMTRESQTLFIMNDRPDLAVLAGADGVHVGQEELTVKDARRILGPSGLVGVSTHSLEQAQLAVLDGANYIGVGPTFHSATKQFSQFMGTELLRCVQAEIRLPAFAIGGITWKNLPQVLATGFTRIAVSGAITAADDPKAAAQELMAALKSHGVH